MVKNVGTIDRVIRVLLAIVFGALIFTGTESGFWAIFLGVLGAIFLLTGLFGTCIIYRIFNLSTAPK
jgi:hypothetical protein